MKKLLIALFILCLTIQTSEAKLVKLGKDYVETKNIIHVKPTYREKGFIGQGTSIIITYSGAREKVYVFFDSNAEVSTALGKLIREMGTN